MRGGLALANGQRLPPERSPMLLQPGWCFYLKRVATSKSVGPVPPALHRTIWCAPKSTRNRKPQAAETPLIAWNDIQHWAVLGGDGPEHLQVALHWNRHRIIAPPGHCNSYPHRLVWEKCSIKITATHDTHNWHDGWGIFGPIPVCQFPLVNFLLS